MGKSFTAIRERKAKPLLENALSWLVKSKGEHLYCGFEGDIGSCWDAGHQDLKNIMEGMLKHERYHPIAVRYMLSSDPCVCSEFKVDLSRFLKIRDFYDAKEREAALKAYWDKFNKEHQTQ